MIKKLLLSQKQESLEQRFLFLCFYNKTTDRLIIRKKSLDKCTVLWYPIFETLKKECCFLNNKMKMEIVW